MTFPESEEFEALPPSTGTGRTSTQSTALARLLAVVSQYRQVILLGTLAVAAAYTIATGIYVLLAPTREVTSVKFRLEFAGSHRGVYPNGLPFSTSEILSLPVLAEVHRMNRLGRFMDLSEFKSSVFILESNATLDALAREYNRRISDPKLSPLDRERIEKEFFDKRAALRHADYALTFVAARQMKPPPRVLVEKSLQDILETWAEQTARSKGLGLQHVSLVSPHIFDQHLISTSDVVVAVDLLRTNILRLISIAERLEALPAGTVVRTPPPNETSLAELRARLIDLQRNTLEPHQRELLSGAISQDPSGTLAYLRSRALYARRAADDGSARVDAVRRALDAYAEDPRSAAVLRAGDPIGGTEAVISQDLLDRLIALSEESEDLRFRQELVGEIRSLSLAVVPLESEAAYYMTLADEFEKIAARAHRPTDAELGKLRASIASTLREGIRIAESMNSLYRTLSEYQTPSSAIYSVTEPATVTIERVASLPRLILLGVLLTLLAVPLSIGAAFIHSELVGARQYDSHATADEEPREDAVARVERHA